MPVTKIECESCYFCTYRKPYKCQFELVMQPIPKHNFCGKFLDRETGRNIRQILTDANNAVSGNSDNKTILQPSENVSEEKKKKLKEFIKTKIENKPN